MNRKDSSRERIDHPVSPVSIHFPRAGTQSCGFREELCAKELGMWRGGVGWGIAMGEKES